MHGLTNLKLLNTDVWTLQITLVEMTAGYKTTSASGTFRKLLVKREIPASLLTIESQSFCLQSVTSQSQLPCSFFTISVHMCATVRELDHEVWILWKKLREYICKCDIIYCAFMQSQLGAWLFTSPGGKSYQLLQTVRGLQTRLRVGLTSQHEQPPCW